MAFFVPLIYLVIAGSAWTVTFHKRYSQSLAPAIILHIIAIMLTGIFFHNLNIGIIIPAVVYTAICIFYLLSGGGKNKNFYYGGGRSIGFSIICFFILGVLVY